MMHQLKIKPEFFEPLRTGMKRCELRKHDRNYSVNDILIISEFVEDREPQYTGRVVSMRITHMIEDEQYGLKKGWVCLSVWREE
jgi:hypothetical protein